jgi:hypothetical protein
VIPLARVSLVLVTVTALLNGSGSAAFARDQQMVSSAEAVAATSGAVAAASALGLTTEVPSAETAQTADGLMSVSRAPDGSEVTVLVPTDLDQPVIALDGSGTSVGIGFPRTAGTAPARIVGDTAVFTDQQAGFATTVQPLVSGAIRTSVTIAGPGSPSQFRFPVSLDSGSSLELREDGSVTVSSEVSYRDEAGNATTRTLVTSTIAAAWAVDADGKAVPTRYSLEGNTLVQHVDLTSTTAFPVVADPFWSTAWHVAKCVSAIAVAMATLMIPVSKVLKLKAFVRAVGGIRTAAKLLVGATSKAEKARVIGGVVAVGAAEVLGIDAIYTNC